MGRPLNADDLRAHPRVCAPARAFVRLLGGKVEELPVRDISRGGLFLHASPGLFEVGQKLELEVELLDQSVRHPFSATVVRVQDGPPELSGFGLRFDAPESSAGEAMPALLRGLITGPGGKRRAHPRIAWRVEVSCTGVKQVPAVLRDLSLGGAGLWLKAPLAMEERVVVALNQEGQPPLQLPAKVVSTRWALNEESFDQAGVEFVDLSGDQRAALEGCLLKVLGL